MGDIFFTSDTHFNHKNIIKYCNRPYASTEEMNSALIDNWNKLVKRDDIVYHLGDFAWSDVRKIRSKLNGKIFLIWGNHDKDSKRNRDLFTRTEDIATVKLPDKNIIVLCHFAMRTWNRSHFGSYHLHGHHHGTLNAIGKTYDVGVDSNDFAPVSLEKILKIMKFRPENENDLRY